MEKTTKEYHVSRLKIKWKLFGRIILTILVLLIFIMPHLLSNTKFKLDFLNLFFPAFALLIIWGSVLSRPNKVSISDGKIIFKSLFRSVSVDTANLLIIKEEKGGKRLRFVLKDKSVRVSSVVKTEMPSMLKF